LDTAWHQRFSGVAAVTRAGGEFTRQPLDPDTGLLVIILFLYELVVFAAVQSAVPRRGAAEALRRDMRRRITNLDPEARDARPINFESADALEFINEYSGLAPKGPAVSLSQNSSTPCLEHH